MYTGSGGGSPFILTVAADEVSGHFHTPRSASAPIGQEVGWKPEPVLTFWVKGKIFFFLLGFEQSFHSCVASSIVAGIVRRLPIF